jgi:hypothetical protein
VEVERRMLVGEAAAYRKRLCQAGLSGRINTSYVERLNLTIRQCVSKLTRRTWGPAKFTPELMEHLEWWRAYYHFVRAHESLEEELAQPVKRKGKQQPKKYLKRTPAMVAGLTDRRWTVKELLRYPLPDFGYTRDEVYAYWAFSLTRRLDFRRKPGGLNEKHANRRVFELYTINKGWTAKALTRGWSFSMWLMPPFSLGEKD